MQPLVGVVMGSDSDFATMRGAVEVCQQFGIAYEVQVVSAHRTPDDMAEYGRTAHERGLRVIIAGAGGAAHLPGMLAAHTPLPVIGVPVPIGNLQGVDALLSIVQMPAGVPVATVAIGQARNAGLLAVQIIATGDAALLQQIIAYKAELADASRAKSVKLQEQDRKSTRLNSSHANISYAVFCLKKKNKNIIEKTPYKQRIYQGVFSIRYTSPNSSLLRDKLKARSVSLASDLILCSKPIFICATV